MSDTYEHDLHEGWKCFHCGEKFFVPADAALHFGSPAAQPGCMARVQKRQERGLLYALRAAEYERDLLEVRLVCLRMGRSDLEEESVERFRATRGLIGEMAEFYIGEHPRAPVPTVRHKEG